MTKLEMGELLQRISNIYPSFKLDDQVLDTWSYEFRDENSIHIGHAVDAYIKEGGEFAPKIPSIWKALRAQRIDGSLTNRVERNIYTASPEDRAKILSQYKYFQEVEFKKRAAYPYADWLRDQDITNPAVEFDYILTHNRFSWRKVSERTASPFKQQIYDAFVTWGGKKHLATLTPEQVDNERARFIEIFDSRGKTKKPTQTNLTTRAAESITDLAFDDMSDIPF